MRPAGSGGTQLTLRVVAGKLACRSCEISGTGTKTSVQSNGRVYSHTVKQRDGRTSFQLEQALTLNEGSDLNLEIRA